MQATRAKTEKEVAGQKELDSEAENVKRAPFNDVACLRERAAAASRGEVELFSSTFAANNHISRTTADLRFVRDKISTQSKELVKVAQFKSSTEVFGDNVMFYEASEEKLKKELVVTINDSTRLSKLANEMRAEVADIRERLGVWNSLIRLIIDYSCASLGPSLRGLIEISVRA